MREMPRCAVCGSPAPSPAGPAVFVYCDSCLRRGLEPYIALVAQSAGMTRGLAAACLITLNNNLHFHGRTLDQFLRDVRELDPAYHAAPQTPRYMDEMNAHQITNFRRVKEVIAQSDDIGMFALCGLTKASALLALDAVEAQLAEDRDTLHDLRNRLQELQTKAEITEQKFLKQQEELFAERERRRKLSEAIATHVYDLGEGRR